MGSMGVQVLLRWLPQQEACARKQLIITTQNQLIFQQSKLANINFINQNSQPLYQQYMQNQPCSHLIQKRQQMSTNQQKYQTIMHEDYYSAQAELQSLTALIQQQQQLLVNSMNQIISYQPAIDAIIKLSNLCIKLKNKINSKIELQECIETNQIKLQKLTQEKEQVRTKIKKYNDKMYVHIMEDVEGIKILVQFAEKHNIKTMMEDHLTKFVYLLIHNNQRCPHNMKKTNKNSSQCFPGCQFGDLSLFILEYKSENIYYKFRQLWLDMERQLHSSISSYLRQFQQEIIDIGGKNIYEENCEQLMQNIKIEQMNMKVDLQIIKSQIKTIVMSIGLFWSLETNYILTNQDIVLFLKQAIQKNRYSYFHGQSKLYCHNCELQISYVFFQHIDQVTKSYNKENKNNIKTQQCELRFIQATLTRYIQALNVSLSIIQNQFALQKKISQLQKKILVIRQQTFIHNQNVQKYDQCSSSVNQVSTCSQLCSYRTNQTKNQISINVRYSRQSMLFKVIKTMHISNISNIKSSAISRISSRISSKSSSRVSLSPLKIDRKNSRMSLAIQQTKNQPFNERILQFGKNKLILRKEHPLFHEQIQIKRIQSIKITNFDTINIYFKKGYMTIQFLARQRIPSNQNVITNRYQKSLAKEWVKCFKAIYFQQIDTIVFQQNEDIKLNSQEESQLETIKKQKVHCQKYQKQNIRINFDTFAQNFVDKKKIPFLLNNQQNSSKVKFDPTFKKKIKVN